MAHLHICSICLRLVVLSLTEIQYFQIEPGGKGTHTNGSIMFKMFYLCGFVNGQKRIIIYSFISFWNLQLNEKLQSQIKHESSLVENHRHN